MNKLNNKIRNKVLKNYYKDKIFKISMI